MTRKEEFEKVKTIIKENIEDANLGLFFTRNFVGDRMHNIFNGEFFEIDICYGCCYYEVFGCTEQEEEELDKFYQGIC